LPDGARNNDFPLKALYTESQARQKPNFLLKIFGLKIFNLSTTILLLSFHPLIPLFLFPNPSDKAANKRMFNYNLVVSAATAATENGCRRRHSSSSLKIQRKPNRPTESRGDRHNGN
jgi:hypothetical protein